MQFDLFDFLRKRYPNHGWMNIVRCDIRNMRSNTLPKALKWGLKRIWWHIKAARAKTDLIIAFFSSVCMPLRWCPISCNLFSKDRGFASEICSKAKVALSFISSENVWCLRRKANTLASGFNSVDSLLHNSRHSLQEISNYSEGSWPGQTVAG